jgi:hypothetical protein
MYRSRILRQGGKKEDYVLPYTYIYIYMYTYIHTYIYIFIS